MIRKLLLTLPVITSITLAGSQLTVAAYAADNHDGHAHESVAQANGADEHNEEMEKGPNRGRLLKDGNFAIELTIFETGVEPEFRVFAYENGKALDPGSINLSIDLSRLDGQIDEFSFKAEEDYLRGSGVVNEPHSFDVTVEASYKDHTSRWSYENYEGRTKISKKMADASGIKTSIADTTTISEELTLTGRVQTVPNRVAHVRARFPGIVQRINHNIGDTVKAGDVLARIQSNESLQSYSLKAPIDGVILNQNLQLGSTTSDDPLFLITDLSQVWVELDVFSRHANQVETGQPVIIETLDGVQLNGKIDWVSPLSSHASQSIQVRVVMDNKKGLLRPGQFVRGNVTVAEHQVDLAVQKSGIQKFRDFNVVFAKVGDDFEVRMLELGRQNSEWAEVIKGLKPGTEYVTDNSYLIKADIEKSGASHDH